MIKYRNKANRNIAEIFDYIEQQGFPQNAINYKNRLFEFGETLQIFPEKYQICRFEKYREKGYRCAPFDDYIFVYRIEGKDFIVITIVHGKRLSF